VLHINMPRLLNTHAWHLSWQTHIACFLAFYKLLALRNAETGSVTLCQMVLYVLVGSGKMAAPSAHQN